jgi:predicted ABC-type exoprotein transport system permease subunit
MWLVGPRPTYLVSDAQKPAIGKRLRRNRYLRVLWVLVICAIVLMMQATPGLLDRNSVPLFVLLILFAVNGAETLSIRPLLAGLTPTTQPMPVSEL